MKWYYYFLAIILVISMQFTEYKIINLKIADLLSLICCILYIIRKDKVPPFFNKLLFIFSILFFNSLIVLLYIKFYPPLELSLLKEPGVISLSRYIQYVSCVVFSFFIYDILDSKSNNFDMEFCLFIDKIMILFSVFYILMFLISFIGIETFFIYSNHRLRGGYVEGGPFGLFIGFYLIIRLVIFNKIDVYFILFILLILLSQSKAAILFLISFYFIYMILEKKVSFSRVGISAIMTILLLFISNLYFNLFGRLSNYWEYYNNIKYYITLRGEDNHYLVMGRIAAMHITPNMIKDNPVLGVGMGNYSLVRNNPEYLNGLPQVSGWDLTGLGGIYNILIESGFLGLFLFLYPFIYLWRKVRNKMIKYGIVLFFLIQIFGVQLYFQYIWFGLGVFYYLGIKNKSTI